MEEKPSEFSEILFDSCKTKEECLEVMYAMCPESICTKLAKPNESNVPISVYSKFSYFMPLLKWAETDHSIIRPINGVKTVIDSPSSDPEDKVYIIPPEKVEYTYEMNIIGGVVGAFCYDLHKHGLPMKITAEMLLSFGRDSIKINSDSQMEKNIESIIDQLSSIDVFIEFKGGKKSKNNKLIGIKQKLLPVAYEEIYAKKNGEKQRVFCFDHIPPIFADAISRNHIRIIPEDLFRVKSMSFSIQNFSLMYYLAQYILSAKNERKPECYLRFDYLFENLKDVLTYNPLSNPAQRDKRYRDDLIKICEDWKQKGHFISNYELYKKGRTYAGIRFILKKKEEIE